jgi:hypothetical protein
MYFTVGCITEVIARHVSRVGFQPEDLYRPLQDESSMSEETLPSSSSSSSTSQDNVWGKYH